jgi:hypothetical protein
MLELEEPKADPEEIKILRQALRNAHRELAKAKDRTEHLVEVVMQAAYDGAIATGGIPLVINPVKDRRKGKDEVALWHLTDWQLAKETRTYNSQVCAERVQRYVDKAIKLTDVARSHHPVRECYIVMTGDMLEGLFNFPSQAHEIDQTIFGQFTTLARLIADVVAVALSNYERVTVVPEWGNHGRIGSKRDGVPRSDNLDRMSYELAKELVGANKRLTWQDCPEDIQRIEIGNYRALAIHGDEVGRNGFASPMTIVQHVNKWRSGSYDWEFRDVYMGHYHTHAEWPLANGLGSVYQTGSTESDNRYAGVMLASASTPSQRLHFIDPRVGRVTATHKIWVD